MSVPRKFKDLVYLLDRKCNFKTVLIVNTNGIPQTGEFLDHILEEKNPVRIQYTNDKHNEFIYIYY